MAVRRVFPLLASLLVALGTALAAPQPAVAAAASPDPVFTKRAVTPLPNGSSGVVIDAVTKRLFVSSYSANVVTVLGLDGAVQGSIPVPGAGALLVDGSTLYVAAATAGRVDAFDTTTLAPAGSYGAGTLVEPGALAKAGGRVWTTTGCASDLRLASFVPGTAAVTVHPYLPSLHYCPGLAASPMHANVLLAWEGGLSPTTVVRLDVSSGAPVEAASRWDVGSFLSDLEFLPDGQTFALAGQVQTYRVDSLEPWGVIYRTGTPSTAVESTAANGGLIAAAGDGASASNPDIDIFRLGDPSKRLFVHFFDSAARQAHGGSMAFSPDGSTLYVVSGEGYNSEAAQLDVFGPPDPGGRYHPLPPARILDTRDAGPAGRLGPDATLDVPVTGRGGVPSTGVSAVALNVTVTQPTATSFLTLSPAGQPRPLASNLNFNAGQTIPNLALVKVGAGGKISMYNLAGATDVILDVAGWYSGDGDGPAADGRYTALVPSRLLDTRDAGVRLGPNQSLDLQVAGRGGVPVAGAEGAVLNVTATGPTATSFVTVHPTGIARPLASNLNFNAGDSASNRVMATLGAGGKVTIYNLAGATDIVVDVSGWFSDSSVTPASPGALMPSSPYRLLDTRQPSWGRTGPIAGGTAMSLFVTIPPSPVKALILNATVVEPSGPGFLTLFPSGGELPLASDVNYAAGETRPNLTVVAVGADGKIVVYSSATAHVVLDVAGWIT